MENIVNSMSDNTRFAFKILVDLFKEPKFETEEIASKTILEFNKELDGFFKDDIKKACLSLFKWKKSLGFPSINHLLSELLNAPKQFNDDTYFRKKISAPPEFSDVWEEACTFLTTTRAFICNDFYVEAMKVFDKISIPLNFQIKDLVFNAFETDDFNNKGKYPYSSLFLNYVLAFKYGVFDDIKKAIKNNIKNNSLSF